MTNRKTLTFTLEQVSKEVKGTTIKVTLGDNTKLLHYTENKHDLDVGEIANDIDNWTEENNFYLPYYMLDSAIEVFINE